ncbi:MAG: hypothetical protein ACRBBN_05125 [Methyloligellaceae bacterium]
MIILDKTGKIEKRSIIHKTSTAYFLCFVLLFLAIFNTQKSGASDLASSFNDRSKYILNIQHNNGFAINDIRETSRDSIPVQISLPASLQSGQGKKTWLRVLGLPAGLEFSKGAQVNQIWFIPSQDTANLQMKLPDGYTGSFNLNFFLMRGEQTVVSIMGKKKINVTILASTTAKRTIPQAETSEAEPQEKLSPQEEAILLKRADQLMKLGTFAPARIIYEELALRGSATAAENLAGTYDPSVIQNSSISGLEPDVEKARKWYEHARKLRSQAIN